jgi:hypothetical protein
MLILYGQCDESATVAPQEYAVRFPNREHPSRNTKVYFLIKEPRPVDLCLQI